MTIGIFFATSELMTRYERLGMAVETKFGMLRKILRAIGLSQESSDDAVNFIVDLLAGESKGSTTKASTPEFPYHLRDNFLSPAELNFYSVLKSVVNTKVIICTKVSLSDIFYVKRDDPSRYRIYTNKIDRKHIDFLLCEPNTMRPLLGIELDDKSHERKDRQERDAFVDEVFQAAGLRIVHIPAQRSYNTEDIASKLTTYVNQNPQRVNPITPPTPTKQEPSTPVCSKCGGEMILRTAKKGENAGGKFWGCSNYPTCRNMMPYE